jgi:hypothetical protein
VNVLSFSSHEEMRAYLIQAQADALRSLHPLQRGITFGDCWVRFVNIAERHVEFGRVALPEETLRLEIDAGATYADARAVVQRDQQAIKNGYLYGVAYSRYNREGEWGHTHKANVWPIEEWVFNDASEANWQVDLLPMSSKINLNIAFLGWRGRKG